MDRANNMHSGITRRAAVLSLVAGFLGFRPDKSKAQSASFDASVQKMVDKAVTAIEKFGLKRASKETAGEIWERKEVGLYVFVIDGDGFLLLHPDRRMVGVNIRGSVDTQGTQFIRKILNALPKHGGTFWSEYLWFDPIDGRTRRKRVFSKKVGDLIVNCGYYLDQA